VYEEDLKNRLFFLGPRVNETDATHGRAQSETEALGTAVRCHPHPLHALVLHLVWLYHLPPPCNIIYSIVIWLNTSGGSQPVLQSFIAHLRHPLALTGYGRWISETTQCTH
jgi:hypothetical protein